MSTRAASKGTRPGLVDRLVKESGGESAKAAIEDYADECRRKAMQNKLPIKVDLVASCLGIRQRSGRYPFAGRIYAEPSGQLVMDLNTDDNPARQRFTCAHEIIHTAFPGFVAESRYRTDVHVGSHNPREPEEYLCDFGAATLLMPRELVVDAYSAARGLRDVERLAEDADVSLEAAANRLVALADEPVAVLVFRWGHKPADSPALRRGEAVSERLRLRYALTHDLDVFVPKYKSADDDSVFVQALASLRIQCAIEPLPGARPPFRVEAKQYPWGDELRVIALARPVET
jgi:Zn-dependent peptidase ImmA (M78 family)